MARYPELPRLFNLSDKQLINMYTAIERWGSALLNELNTRDTQVETTPSTNIYTISTLTQLKNPQKGDIAYSVSSGKFKGYVSLGAETSWQNLN